MTKGKLNIQAADGAVIGLVVPDGLTSSERQIALGANLSGITAYHLLQGNLAVSNSTITQGFNTTLYTSGSATTGIDMSTQWGNTAEEKFGGLVWLKDRAEATNNFLYDTVRGATKEINTNTTEAEATLAGGLTAFNSNGFTVGADAGHNSTTNNMASWNFQTTHRVSGTTNHGKAYTCHFNPFTGFTIVKYEGSGIAGHEIPHHLGRKLNFQVIKNLSAIHDWVAGAAALGGGYLLLNTTVAFQAQTGLWYPPSGYTDTSIILSVNNIADNTNTNQYIMYGWTNSYLDESNKLIGNYELVPYQGTGVAGNKIKTKGKPAWVMIKCTSATGDWAIKDNQRGSTKLLYANSSIVEQTEQTIDFILDGFIVQTADQDTNASGGQYIALVAYDTNSNGGGSYYPLASDTANVQINNALIPLAQGIDSNGAKNTILSKNETITGLTYTQGKNYVYCDKNGSYGVTSYKPRYLESELVRTYAGEQPDYFDVNKNKWFNTSGHGELVTNGTFDSGTTGWTALNGVTSNPSNTLQFTANLSVLAYVYTSISTTVGSTYTLKVTTNSMSDSQVWLYIGSTYNNGDAYLHSGSTPWTLGIKDVVFTAVSTTTYICFRIDNGRVVNLDNISVFATEIVPTTEITNSRNYLNHIVHADNDGGVLYVEELPKIEYKDIIKANELKCKNACTALISFDGTTTPITIRDSYNVSAIIRVATGVFDIYFKEQMDNTGYSIAGTGQYYDVESPPLNRYLNKVQISTGLTGSTRYNDAGTTVTIMGGKN